MRRGIRIGVDLGAVRIGIARSDPDALMAVPVQTLPGGEPAEVAGVLCRIAAEFEAIEIVVGLPRSLSGNDGAAAQRVRRYADVIARRAAPIPVRLVDERMTTVTATRSLREAGVRGPGSRRVVDQVAATVILQAALDGERISGRPAGALVPVESPVIDDDQEAGTQ